MSTIVYFMLIYFGNGISTLVPEPYPSLEVCQKALDADMAINGDINKSYSKCIAHIVPPKA